MSGAAHGVTRQRLAIVGGGSSGLITLKYALDGLPDWEIVCFEKSPRTIGCWGNPYPGFVSTSTKYTTQFACYPRFAATVHPDRGASRDEFFRADEYGRYLEQFVEAFGLAPHISLQTRVDSIRRHAPNDGWELTITRDRQGEPVTTIERFDCVVVCSGRTAQPVQLDCQRPCISAAALNQPEGLSDVSGQRIVVVGGGESAVDLANRLAAPALGNQVFLSLKSGIRVSPRYHPIRGVPSDFLRNRLMLSIHEDMRNAIGQWFVESRIRYQETFEWLFPGAPAKLDDPTDDSRDRARRRKHWACHLTRTAKDDLFNMFHNKADDFLDAVAEERIKIVGPPLDSRFATFTQFDSEETVEVDPDLVAPAVGFRATLPELFGDDVRPTDFFLGCCHLEYRDLYLVGFARPVIGNIPTISEMQARYVCGLIAGKFSRPENIAERHRAEQAGRERKFAALDNSRIYAVEMFPYCDRLARLMKQFPGVRSVGSLALWCRMQLSPATTMHYERQGTDYQRQCREAPIYMPPSLIGLLLALKPLSWAWSAWRSIWTVRVR